MPKANGYEALHATVMGPEGKWVEVQIRSERMDDIAERGFAAHYGNTKARRPTTVNWTNGLNVFAKPTKSRIGCIRISRRFQAEPFSF
jgi:(p)ppGpp synthase/HD superfamily hydrolase